MIWYLERISRKYEFFENDKIVFESMCATWNKSNLDHVKILSLSMTRFSHFGVVSFVVMSCDNSKSYWNGSCFELFRDILLSLNSILILYIYQLNMNHYIFVLLMKPWAWPLNLISYLVSKQTALIAVKLWLNTHCKILTQVGLVPLIYFIRSNKLSVVSGIYFELK